MKIIKEKKEEYNILFIGNSYTYFNESWNIFKKIGKEQGININTHEVTSDGYTLEKNVRPIIDKEKFFIAVRKLYKLIIKNDATPLLYETWGRKEERPDLIKFNLTNESMTKKLIESYQ